MRKLPLAVALVLSFVTLGTGTTPASAQTFDRGWIDFNVISATPAQDAQTYTFSGRLFQETAAIAAVYPDFPRATGVLFGGGAGIGHGLGLGVQWTAINCEYTVGLGISIPHPVFFNRPGSDGDVTHSMLERKDNAVDISAVYQLPTLDAWRIRVFGGPTYFSVKQDFVNDIRYTQTFNLLGANNVDITGFTQETVDDSAWGYHVGADVSFFFSKHLGVGGGLRVNRGTAKLASEPLSEGAAELKMGAAHVGGGLRIRF